MVYQIFKTVMRMSESDGFIKLSFPATSLNVVIKCVETLQSGGQMFIQMDLEIK
jgi:hypothetical protein